jgi:hypothetical protein
MSIAASIEYSVVSLTWGEHLHMPFAVIEQSYRLMQQELRIAFPTSAEQADAELWALDEDE